MLFAPNAALNLSSVPATASQTCCCAVVPVKATDKALKSVPLAVIEIWSPEDRMPRQMARFEEYWNRGVRQIVVLDPEEFTAFRYENRALAQCEIEDLELPNGGKVPFSSKELLNET